MVDVLHYTLEEDMRYSSAEQADAVASTRTQIYLMYNKTYKYGSKSSDSSRQYISPGTSNDLDLDPMMAQQESKPYIPPTQLNPDSSVPFGTNLDSPLG